MDPLRSHYERNLPHRLPPGSALFLTYRLAGNIPQAVRQLWLEEMQLPVPADEQLRRNAAFGRYDRWLDHDQHGLPQWLARPEIAAVVRESLLHFNGREYDLHSYCIMPNHVHVLLTVNPALERPFFRVLQSQKRFSGAAAYWRPRR